jgi:phosphoribosylformylglycinamidine cyclo-ligase
VAITYRDSGVDIEEGDRLVERIAPVARRTMRPEVLAGIGGFASMVRIPAGYREPILVSGTDGVGTKLKLAFLTGRHDTIGQDLVAMCANDVVVTGAEPLFFLDYFASGKLDAGVATTVIAGIAEGCRLAGCALVGGETAELPGFYADGEYDLAGFCVGVVEKDDALDGKRVKLGDAVIGLASTGLHSNGYSLARKVVLEAMGLSPDDRPAVLGGRTVGDALLEPTRIYVGDLLGLRKAGVDVRAAAHVTGGGLPGNVPRTLPDGVRAVLDASAWKPAPIFDLIRQGGAVEAPELLQTFNCGLGFTVVVPPAHERKAIEFLATRGVVATRVGTIEAGAGEATCVVEGWR